MLRVLAEHYTIKTGNIPACGDTDRGGAKPKLVLFRSMRTQTEEIGYGVLLAPRGLPIGSHG
ncbi:hypothetical protein [Arthrospiribacter ruber]|uniref:Uncharacterized protein n=1 Tax=Arthrospiribacter ruber TaxID=2487934 RepID=A0A951IVU4_9BACT|nr:hypothetical protein [Arthrospiribacter ruber]MBW3466651.1 hypothetical protein [Arthrospiribacter ruber]